jgi:ubiquinone/menaquinone biosynthesis C-methylase UbiE
MINRKKHLQVKDYKRHYKVDAELFDYFDESNKFDCDYNRRLHQLIFRFIKGEGQKILDAGSGNGWILENNPHKNHFVLTDLSFKNLSKIHSSDVNGNYSCLASDVLHLPFHDQSFNVIVLSEVLEHLNDPELAVKNLFRILKNKGKLIITTPYNEIIRYYLCIHCNQKTSANAHLHSFNEDKLSDIFKKNGINNFRFYKIGNKYFLRSMLSYFLKFIPFPIWRIIDSIFNFIVRKPLTIVTVIEK